MNEAIARTIAALGTVQWVVVQDAEGVSWEVYPDGSYVEAWHIAA
jgi:hypothetical protein